MSTEPIETLEQVTPAWLNEVLSRSGALEHGAVEGFGVEPGRGVWSSNARLSVIYSPSSEGAQPKNLFLKMVNTNLGMESFDDSEVRYYTRDYVGMPDAPVIRCYDAAYSEEKHRYHLLLDDLSATHFEAALKPPTLDYGLALAEGLAALHAPWWGAEGLAAAGAYVHTPGHIQRYTDIAEPGLDPILARFGPQLEPHWPGLMREIFAHHPGALIERSYDWNGFTVIHGDPNIFNILVPREGDRPIYLIDRQPFDWSLTVWLGVFDLAYAMVLPWERETRRRLELPILKHYHHWLLQRGVDQYSWDRLWGDYRLSVPMCVYVATEYCRAGVIEDLPAFWLPTLRRSLTACDDLDCREVWQNIDR